MTHRFRGIQFWESVKGRSPGSPRVRRSFDNSSASRTIDVNWMEVETFTQEALGYSEVKGLGTATPYISRTVPWNFPSTERPRSDYGLWCDSVEYEGMGVPDPEMVSQSGATVNNTYTGSEETAMAKYKLARCNVNFRTRTYDILTDQQFAAMPISLAQTKDESLWKRYITKIARPQGELITISGTNNGYYAANLYVNGRPFPISTNFNKVIASCNYSVTWHEVPEDAVPMREYNPSGGGVTNPNYGIDRCLGRVNNADFNGCLKWTLLFLAVEIKPMRDPFGYRVYDITYMFKKFQPDEPRRIAGEDVASGHNHVYLPSTRLVGATLVAGGAATPGWYEVMSDSSRATTAPFTNITAQTRSVNIYDSADFKFLFRPVQFPAPQ